MQDIVTVSSGADTKYSKYTEQANDTLGRQYDSCARSHFNKSSVQNLQQTIRLFLYTHFL